MEMNRTRLRIEKTVEGKWIDFLRKAFRINCFIIHLKAFCVRLLPHPLLGSLHENFIQQGFKFPVMKSDLIKLIDSNEAFQWVWVESLAGGLSEWVNVGGEKFNLGDKEIRNLFVQVLDFTCNFSKHAICKENQSPSGEGDGKRAEQENWKIFQMQ